MQDTTSKGSVTPIVIDAKKKQLSIRVYMNEDMYTTLNKYANDKKIALSSAARAYIQATIDLLQDKSGDEE